MKINADESGQRGEAANEKKKKEKEKESNSVSKRNGAGVRALAPIME